MAAALVRHKGFLVLALSTSLHGEMSSAFHHGLVRRASAPSRIALRDKSTSSAVGDDPKLNNDGGDYEWLKRSRPVRIRARLVPPGSAIDGATGPSPATRIVHFQRHGQGTHNEIYRRWTETTGVPLDLSETDPGKNPLLTDAVLDAPLTQKGRDQCEERRSVARKLEGLELIVVSPLARALQTAHITFRDHLPRNTPRNVKWMVHEGVREELGTLLCNKRRPLSATESEFPEVDYGYLPPGEEDVMWNDHVEKTSSEDGITQRETVVDMSHRAYHFLVDFVHSRPEREIAVVGHSAWLLAMTGAVLDVGEDESLIAPMFGQAELRTMELTFLEQ